MKIFTLFLLIIILTPFVRGQDPPQWIIYNTSNSQLPSNNVGNIVVDNSNRKWVSFWYYGLLKIVNESWTMYDTTNSEIPSNIIRSINVDENLNLWAGGYNDNGNFRLTKFDGVNWTIWNSSNSPIPANDVMALIFDNQNDLWLLCKDTDNVFNTNYVIELTQDSVWNFHTSFETFTGNRQMLFDNDQILWIGDWHGIYKYDGDTLIYIQGHPGQYVTDIKLDSLGNIWIATGLNGWGHLVKYDGISFTSYTNIQAISIEIDILGNVWVGTESFTYQAELIKYDGSNWTSYNQSNSPLPATRRISDLAFDKLGNLWIGTLDSGLVVFNENGIAIPVELQSFTAEVIGNDINLNWNTATETNNMGFEIEKKSGNWQKIGFVTGHGTTTEPQYYSFFDESVEPGINQYRLKQIDYDGSFEYSDIVEVEIGLPTEFSLEQNYPNPFNPTTTINYQTPELSYVTLKVYDVLGSEVAILVNEEKPLGIFEVEFNATGLPSGIYFYKIQAGNFIETKKMTLLR